MVMQFCPFKEKFKRLQQIGKANRSSEKGGSLHMGGSKSGIDHASEMAKLTQRPVHLDELFKQTYIKKDGAYVDERSRKTINTPPPNELDVWRDVAGVRKGRIYGLVLESTVVNRNYRGSSSSFIISVGTETRV